MEDILKNSWSDEDHADFYGSLKNFPKQEQSQLVLLQAARLTNIADLEDEDMLKAAESLVNFWILKYANSAENRQADYLLDNIHQKLEEIREKG